MSLVLDVFAAYRPEVTVLVFLVSLISAIWATRLLAGFINEEANLSDDWLREHDAEGLRIVGRARVDFALVDRHGREVLRGDESHLQAVRAQVEALRGGGAA